jgi:hypothetical protein
VIDGAVLSVDLAGRVTLVTGQILDVAGGLMAQLRSPAGARTSQ